MVKAEIRKIIAREILDSRGTPTILAEVELGCGVIGVASVPSGASVGKYEAVELRDIDPGRYGGRGVLTAMRNINEIIAPALSGKDAKMQAQIDRTLRELDGTKNKSKLGANAVLAVSLATARAAANYEEEPLFRYLQTISAQQMPTPMFNVINGGLHAKNNLEIQEFMLVPTGIDSTSDAVRAGAEIYKALKEILASKCYSSSVGDEGGFAPDLKGDEEAIELLIQAIELAGYTTKDVKIALDVAASGWWQGGDYLMPKSGKRSGTEDLINYYEKLITSYPIISIEDGLGEDDEDGFTALTSRIGEKVMIVGDDLFVTNAERLRQGIEKKMANAILIKPNQIGTLTEVLNVIDLAQSSGYKFIISHRSGETGDTFISDLAVATGSPFIKAGAPCRGERVEKYNRLMKIETMLKRDFVS